MRQNGEGEKKPTVFRLYCNVFLSNNNNDNDNNINTALRINKYDISKS